ncbi:flavodoxin [Pedobacter jeongneungensis]|uniref:flavodoxin n=1 Tax=Pedobacter jeongneungensis TaxID=947309 RepID=UPI000B009897|nr:flavodoxin [Pedobacter jeongneungensis]
MNTHQVKEIIMKRTLNISGLLIVLGCLISSCSNAEEKPAQVKLSAPQKILIVYLSRTNNTKTIAEIIHSKVGGDLVAIEMEKPYPEDYKTTVAQVANENESGFLPLLKTKIENIGQYDLIYIGFPTWGMALPPPVKSFLRRYDLKGKTVIPFNTNAGYGIGSTFDTVKELCPYSKVIEGFTMKGGIERDGVLLVIKDEKRKQAETQVVKWLRKINMLQH